MKIRKLIALLLAFIMLLPVQVFAAGTDDIVTDSELGATEWQAEDFTYADIVLEESQVYNIYTMGQSGNRLTGTKRMITGLSETGAEKIASNKELVIPDKDAEGNTVNGVDSEAFRDQGITSVTFPSGIVTDNEGKWDESVSTRGDFFIGSQAFYGNELTELVIPEGTLFIGFGAFGANRLTEVSFPSTLMMISSRAFANNELSSLLFTDNTDFPLQVDSFSFAYNRIEEVFFPEKTDKVTKYAFLCNTGVEPVTSGTEEELKGGIVYMYITNPGKFIEDVTNKSNVQKLFPTYTGGQEEEDEDDTDTWTSEDFTYGEFSKRLYGCDYSRDFTVEGIAVTGFSEKGIQKLENNKDLVIPAKDDEGHTIVGVGKEAFKGKGLTSVVFPSGMLVAYNDTLSYRITKRGNFVIDDNAFANNQLTSVNLPDGVIAVLTYAFANNQLTTVTLPKTIWWVETYAFANNQITKVKFPETTYFQFEMHGMPFANNQIRSVRLPDLTAVVNKYSFMLNPGMEPLPEEAANYMAASAYENSGVVYMYTDSVDMEYLDRIHHIDKPTGSTHSWFQKLIINDGSAGTQNPDDESWHISDFTVSGTTITGLSDSGIEKRKKNPDLVIPDYNANAEMITEIAAAPSGQTGGLFATEEEKFETVTLPSGLVRIGANAFREAGLKDVAFPPALEEIGEAAFQMNSLKAVVLPDTVTKLGGGAFASNKTLETVILSSGLTEIPNGAFGGSDSKNWMKKLTSIEIPEGVTKIGEFAFAGNNFHKIIIPEGVTEIGRYAFSTKNYLLLDDPVDCELRLPSTLKTIGNRAFRNKRIASVDLPASVEKLTSTTFEKVLSTYGTPDIPGSTVYDMKTKVYLRSRAQFEDTASFPESKYHEIIFTGFDAWEPDDFTYDDISVNRNVTLHVVTGLSGSGEERIASNTEVAIPAADGSGNAVQGIGDNAFRDKGITGIRMPEEAEDYHIGASAFAGNNLEKVALPQGTGSVGSESFRGNGLRSLTVPASVTEIGSGAFEGNELSSLTFEAEESEELAIRSRAFALNKLRAVTLPAKTAVLAGDAFVGNKGRGKVTEGTEEEQSGGIVYVYIAQPGDGVESIENDQSNVQKVITDEQMPDPDKWQPDDFEYAASGNAILGFSEEGYERLAFTQTVVLPEKGPGGSSIIGIDDGAFAVDEQSVDVGKYDYNTAEGISSIVLPESLEWIGDRAFEFNSLVSIDFSKCSRLSRIGERAFKGNKLVSVEIPDTVTELGDGAFTANNIHTLKLSKGVTAIPQGAFSMNIRLSHIDIPDTVTEIGPMAFAGARLEDLTIPSSVRKIERKAFHLHHIRSLTIPGNVKEIGESAFEGTYKALTLKSLILEEGIESIGKYAFKEGLLTEVKLPVSLQSMGTEPFLNNKGQGSEHVVKLTTSNKDHLKFGEGAKYHTVVYVEPAPAPKPSPKPGPAPASAASAVRNGDTAAVASGTVKVLSASAKTAAFTKAKNKKSVTVPATVRIKGTTFKVTQIEANAFKGKKIRTVIIGKNVKKIKKNAFRGSKATKMIVKTKALRKSSVKGSLKGSKIKTVKVKVGKTKVNKKYVRKYKKIFTKKNCGRKVKVKR